MRLCRLETHLRAPSPIISAISLIHRKSEAQRCTRPPSMRMGRVDEKSFDSLDILIEHSLRVRAQELSLDLTPAT